MIEGRSELIMRVRYACDMCESDFSRRNTLTKHKFNIHGIPTRKYTKKKMGKERQPKESSKRAMRLFKKFSLKNYDDEAIKDIISEGIGGDTAIDEVITDLTDVGKIDDLELKQLSKTIAVTKEKGVLLNEQTYTILNALNEEQRELLILEINHRALSEEKSIRTSINDLFSSTTSHSFARIRQSSPGRDLGSSSSTTSSGSTGTTSSTRNGTSSFVSDMGTAVTKMLGGRGRERSGSG
jgi:hypothetical protein